MGARRLGLAMLLLLGGLGCRPEVHDLDTVRQSVPLPAPKIVLIGLDGADWNVARPLMEQGRMPTLARLVEQGASGDLRSIRPIISPALWTTVVTGVRRESHGILDFVYKQPGAYAQPIVNSSIRQRLALWNIFSELGLTVGVLDWYATWPAEEVNGFVVSDRVRTIGPEQAGTTYPPYASLEASLPLDALPSIDELTAARKLRDAFEVVPEGLAKALREDGFRYGAAKSLYRAYRPDLFVFYFKGIDAVGHFYWKHHQPDAEEYAPVDPGETSRLGTIVGDYYELCDQMLGAFLEEVDDDTTVLLVSDHGFRPFGRPDSLIFDLDRLFSMLGLLEFEDPGTADQRSTRRIRMTGTRAYTHEGTKIVSAFGERDRPVYLNVAGRDPEGILDGATLRQERAKIVQRLGALRTDLGTKLFSKIRVNDVATGDHPVQEPDLYLRVNREIAFDHDLLIDEVAYPLFEVFLWEYGNISGSHRDDGILVARGPSIRPGVRVESASLLDITPTVLRIAGLPVPDDLDGRVLGGMLTDSAPRNGLNVASFEGMITRKYPEVATEQLDEDYRERLKALGYVQ